MRSTLNSNLLGDLYRFGLNPNDWDIERDLKKENQFLIVNRRDPDFQLKGSVEYRPKDKAHWTELSIAST